MNRHRVTEDPGVWRLVHDTEPQTKITLDVLEAPGMRARTIEIIANGAVRIDGRVIMSALTPRRRAIASPKPEDALTADIRRVVLEVEEVSGVTVEEMRGRSQKPRISQARKAAIFLAERRLGLTHEDVGRYFNRERSVVSEHVADVEEQLAGAAPPDYGRGEVSESKEF